MAREVSGPRCLVREVVTVQEALVRPRAGQLVGGHLRRVTVLVERGGVVLERPHEGFEDIVAIRLPAARRAHGSVPPFGQVTISRPPGCGYQPFG